MATTTNYTGLSYIEETTEGVTPDTPEFQLLPTTGGSPVSNITTATSEVIRADRQTDDLTVVDSDVTGDINYELSYEPYKPFMVALMQNDVTSTIDVSAASCDGTADLTIIEAVSINTNIDIGDTFRLVSATDPNVNGGYVCIDNSNSGKISIDPPLPEGTGILSDLVLNTTTIIKNGANKPKSYTFKKLAINNGSDNYWYYRGIKINSMNWNFATGSILNGSFNIVGLTETATNTKIPGEVNSDLPVPDYSIMNSVTSIGTIYLEGVSLGTCSFESLDLVYDNQITAAKSIGKLGACATASYSVNITGSVSVFFQDLSLYNKFLNAESFGVSIVLEDGDSNVIGLNMPKCKFETLDTPIDSKDQFLKQSGSFKALRDSEDNYMFKLSLADAA